MQFCTTPNEFSLRLVPRASDYWCRLDIL